MNKSNGYSAVIGGAEVAWVSDGGKEVASLPDGTKVAMRYGNELVEVQDVFGRLAKGEMGEDLPIVMADFGCDYDAACDAVFGENFEAAAAMLRIAVRDARSSQRMRSDRPRVGL